jgi:hypothetical protein
MSKEINDKPGEPMLTFRVVLAGGDLIVRIWDDGSHENQRGGETVDSTPYSLLGATLPKPTTGGR